MDKVREFAAELAAPTTAQAERLLALKYLLHFVGDQHQPLHASDNHDRGGNCVLLALGGARTQTRTHIGTRPSPTRWVLMLQPSRTRFAAGSRLLSARYGKVGMRRPGRWKRSMSQGRPSIRSVPRRAVAMLPRLLFHKDITPERRRPPRCSSSVPVCD